MTTLLGASLILLVALLWMRVYVRRHPPEISAVGLAHLGSGLSFACLSSGGLASAYLIWIIADPVSIAPQALFMLLAAGGNVCNATALVFCLRELSGEGLFAALLVGAAQLLWLLFGLLAMVWGGF